MVSPHFPPVELGTEERGHVITFVLSGGCNLRCSFCFIRQRDEVGGGSLSVENTLRFFNSVRKRNGVLAASIQGHEPLVEKALPYTAAILSAAQTHGIPSGLVTNGVLLADAVPILASAPPTKIAVSIDSSSEVVHDRIRGVAGAWAATVKGIRFTLRLLGHRTKIAVNSVLLPSDKGQLQSMPELLMSLGVTEWNVTPLQRVGQATFGGAVGDIADIYGHLLMLQETAEAAGLNMIVDDTWGSLRHGASREAYPALRRLQVRTLPAGVTLLRLTPGGYCSVGKDILRKVTGSTPRWIPEEMEAADFLNKLEAEPTGFTVFERSLR